MNINIQGVDMKKRKLLLAAVLTGMSGLSLASVTGADKKWEVYGFTQVDYIQDFKRVNPAWESTLRPSKIPTTPGTYGSDGQAILSVKQSRFGVKGNLPVEDNSVFTKFEFDLFGVGKDEGQTTIRLRHAYGEYGNWLGGQTHSLFMDIDAFPNIIDYWGPAGMVFLRNPQIRYSFLKGDNVIAVAIEHPSDDIDPGKLRTIGEDLGVQGQSDEKFPDITFLSRINREWGHIQGSAILRSIGFETLGTKTNEPKTRQTGYGINLSSNFKVAGKDKIIASVVYGKGIASYMNDGGTDLAPDGSIGNLRALAVPLLGLNAFYEHSWNEKSTSAIGYSSTQVDNTGLQSDSAFHRGEYALVNYLHRPTQNVTVGGEMLWGGRQDKNGAYGTDVRSQITFKYDFSSLDFKGTL